MRRVYAMRVVVATALAIVAMAALFAALRTLG
jgi:hypothetical protein